MTSLASVNGPSSTVTLPPVRRTRAPLALGRRPPLSTMIPDWVASIPNWAIASISAFGGGPDRNVSLDFTSVMKRIAHAPFEPDIGDPSAGPRILLHPNDERACAESTRSLRASSRTPAEPRRQSRPVADSFHGGRQPASLTRTRNLVSGLHSRRPHLALSVPVTAPGRRAFTFLLEVCRHETVDRRRRRIRGHRH